MTALSNLAAEAEDLIAAAEANGLMIDDGNVVDLIADNTDASLDDIRAALVAAGLAARFPRATRNTGPTTIWSVATYIVDRAYGGPEEGGWWYDCGFPALEPGLPLPVFTSDETEAVRMQRYMNAKLDEIDVNYGRREISSVLSDGVYRACIVDGMPAPWPERRPHYE